MHESKCDNLTDKQHAFCHEYLRDFNATQASIRAGYSHKTARSQGQRLLTNVDIRKYLEHLQRPIMEKYGIDREFVLRQYINIATANMAHLFALHDDGTIKTINGLPYLDLEGVHYEVMAAVKDFEVIELPSSHGNPTYPLKKMKITMVDKIQALNVLARACGLWDQVERFNKKVNKPTDKELAQRVAFLLSQARANNKTDDSQLES